MNESKISVRYAKALFRLGSEKKQLECLKTNMEMVFDFCDLSDFWSMIESPIIKTSKKKELVKLIFSEKIDRVALDFLNLIIDNRREIFLKDISRNFLALCRKEQGIKSAVLTSAVSVTKDDKQHFVKILERVFDCKIELEEEINKSIIGGFVLRIEDKQLDASVANQLSKIRREFLN